MNSSQKKIQIAKFNPEIQYSKCVFLNNPQEFNPYASK